MKFIQTDINKYIRAHEERLPGSNQYIKRVRIRKTRSRVHLVRAIMACGVLLAGMHYLPSFHGDKVPTSLSRTVIEKALANDKKPWPMVTKEEERKHTRADFVRKIHILESSEGENDNPDALHNICKHKGGSNEYGYGGMDLMICFKSPEEATARIERWYDEMSKFRTEAQLYCYYNTGEDTEDCDYYKRAKEIKQ